MISKATRKEFVDWLFRGDDPLEAIVAWTEATLTPEDIFDVFDLQEWAEKHADCCARCKGKELESKGKGK